MLIKSISLISAVLPRLTTQELLAVMEHFKKEGLQDFPVQTLLRKLPGKVSPRAEEDLGNLLRHFENHNDLHLYPGHELYPASLLDLQSPPFFLMARGNSPLLLKRGLSVVGSRKFSSDAAVWMRTELQAFTEKWSVNVISGGAHGVDQEAHRLGLRRGGGTVVVLPSGFQEIYPRPLRRWEEDYLDQGAVFLSEWAPWEQVKPYHFHHRNRIIAALSPGTLIVEAGEKSGTVLTANWAATLGRDVGVLPGSPLVSSYRGSLKLLQAGALLIADRWDLDVWWEKMNREEFPSRSSSFV